MLFNTAPFKGFDSYLTGYGEKKDRPKTPESVFSSLTIQDAFIFETPNAWHGSKRLP